ncbi:MAG: anti-sigma factor RsiW [Chlamydiales bacterium]|jgi:anti-sigma factor RsiW
MPPEREPTPDELLAMTYADGELDEASCGEFEARLAAEPALAKEVAGHLSLAVMARKMAPPEPMDHEWKRLELDPMQRAGIRLGWLLLTLGAIGLAGWSIVEVSQSDMELAPRSLVLSLIAGSIVLLLTTLRARLRTLPYDRYTGVER